MLDALEAILRGLRARNYRFTTVTPDTHALVNARPENRWARSLRDVLGFNRCFERELLPPELFDALQAAGACEPQAGGGFRAKLRVASVGEALFLHSGFPTLDVDSVFFGPDSYRFARAIREHAPGATRAVDIGCGSGVGGVVLAGCRELGQPVVLSDVNPRALDFARVNARFARVSAEVCQSDVLASIDGKVDLIVANPPYLVDPLGRAYRNGGAQHGAALSVRIVREGLERLDRDGGGSLLLYTGVASFGEDDPFLGAVRSALHDSRADYTYEEVDPDVFGSELATPAYAEAERIAAVVLRATLAPRRLKAGSAPARSPL